MWKRHIQPGEKVGLKLTASERKLVLESVSCLDGDYEKIIRKTPTANASSIEVEPNIVDSVDLTAVEGAVDEWKDQLDPRAAW